MITSADSACGRKARTSQRWLSTQFLDAMWTQNLEGIPVITTYDRFYLGDGHNNSRMPILHSLPKAELHLHLEGSIAPETLMELAPDVDRTEIEARYRFRDFAGFIETFKWVTGFLQSPEDYGLITRRLLECLERQNVRYAEITLSAGVVLWRKQDFAAIYEAVRRAAAGSAITVFWILDAIRHFGPEHAMEVARLAAERVARRRGGVRDRRR